MYIKEATQRDFWSAVGNQNLLHSSLQNLSRLLSSWTPLYGVEDGCIQCWHKSEQYQHPLGLHFRSREGRTELKGPLMHLKIKVIWIIWHKFCSYTNYVHTCMQLQKVTCGEPDKHAQLIRNWYTIIALRQGLVVTTLCGLPLNSNLTLHMHAKLMYIANAQQFHPLHAKL